MSVIASLLLPFIQIVAKALFKEGNSQLEMEGDDDQGTTQPLPTIKLPSITDESQDEEFTLESEDGGESEKPGRETCQTNGNPDENLDIVKVKSDPSAKLHVEETGDSKLENAGKNVNLMSIFSAVQNKIELNPDSNCELISPTSKKSASTPLSHEETHLANLQVMEDRKCNAIPAPVTDKVIEPHSVSLSAAVVNQSHQFQRNQASIPHSESVDSLPASTAETSDPGKCSTARERNEKLDDNHNHCASSSEITSEKPFVVKSQSSQNSNMSLVSLPMDEKSAIEETLAFLLATPPSRRAKILAKLGLSQKVERTDTNNPVDPCIDLSCQSALQGDDLLSRAPSIPGIELEQSTPSQELMVSKCVADVLQSGGVLFDTQRTGNSQCLSQGGKTPKKPVLEVDLLSPISPNFAEALCRVTDNVSMERLSGNSGKSQVQTLGVERDLTGDFDGVDVGKPPSQTLDPSEPRSGISDDTTLKAPDDYSKQGISSTSLRTSNLGSIPQNISSGASVGPGELVTPQGSFTSVQSNKSNLASRSVNVRSRFTYSTAAPRSNRDGSTSVTPNWMSKAVYVEEEEEQEEGTKGDKSEAKETSVSEAKPTRKFYRSAPCKLFVGSFI